MKRLHGTFSVMLLSLLLFSALPWLQGSEACAAPTPKHLSIMLSWQGERETKGANRSPLIDYMNRRLGLPLGSPYCSSSISLALDSAKVTSPTVRTGLARNFKSSKSIKATQVLSGKKSVHVGDIAIWQLGKSWRGHAALVVRVIDKRTIETMDANTTCDGVGTERDGDGFCKKIRKIAPYDYFGLKWFTRVSYA